MLKNTPNTGFLFSRPCDDHFWGKTMFEILSELANDQYWICLELFFHLLKMATLYAVDFPTDDLCQHTTATMHNNFVIVLTSKSPWNCVFFVFASGSKSSYHYLCVSKFHYLLWSLVLKPTFITCLSTVIKLISVIFWIKLVQEVMCLSLMLELDLQHYLGLNQFIEIFRYYALTHIICAHGLCAPVNNAHLHIMRGNCAFT